MELGELSGAMRKAGQAIVDNANRLTRRAALAVDAAVVLATPVDTGRARANWQVELGAPASGTVDPEDQSGQAAIDKGKAQIEQYKGGSSINITNNLPYIERLNDGWSAQAPAGFVEKAVMVGVDAIVAEAQNIVDGIVKESV